MNNGSIYILGSSNLNALYIGVTNDIETRVLQHKVGIGSKHTEKYNIKHLLYFEHFENIIDAIAREKQLKNWKRQWKLDLIITMNPLFEDLAEGWYVESDLKGATDN